MNASVEPGTKLASTNEGKSENEVESSCPGKAKKNLSKHVQEGAVC